MTHEITPSMIDSWRINYGLDTRRPSEAMKWWADSMDGKAPAGAVAALGLLLDERDAVLNNTDNLLQQVQDQAAEIDRLRDALRYVLEDEQNLIPRATSSCRAVVRKALGANVKLTGMP